MTHWLRSITALTLLAQVASAAGPEIPLWPAQPPGPKVELGPEKDVSKPTDNKIAGRSLIRLGNVTTPTLTVYRPPADKQNGAAVMVFPGGAYHILALDLEGTEVCEWLNSIGVTAVLVKYRVPRREGVEKHTAALQDAQRAMGLLRQKAPELGIDPNRIGVIGFSAGAHLSASVAASGARTYSAIDEADALNSRPNFTLLVYPAYLTKEKGRPELAPEVAVTSNTPPAFVVMTQDDPVGVDNALYYSLAMQQSKVGCELHIYPKGGHGYGLRRTENPLTAWSDLAAQWMRAQGFLSPKNQTAAK